MPLLITGVVSLAEDAAEDVGVLLDPAPVEAAEADVGDLVGGEELLLLLPLLEGLRLTTLDGVLLAFFLSLSVS